MDHHKTMKIIMNNKFNILVSAAILVSTVYYLWIKFRQRNSRMDKKRNEEDKIETYTEKQGIEDVILCSNDVNDSMNSFYMESNETFIDAGDDICVGNNSTSCDTQLSIVDDAITDKIVNVNNESLYLSLSETNHLTEQSFTSELCSQFNEMRITSDSILIDEDNEISEIKTEEDVILELFDKENEDVMKDDTADNEQKDVPSNNSCINVSLIIDSQEDEKPMNDDLEDGEILEDDDIEDNHVNIIESIEILEGIINVEICEDSNEILVKKEEQRISYDLEDGEIGNNDDLEENIGSENLIDCSDEILNIGQKENFTVPQIELISELVLEEELEEGELPEDNGCSKQNAKNEVIDLNTLGNDEQSEKVILSDIRLLDSYETIHGNEKVSDIQERKEIEDVLAYTELEDNKIDIMVNSVDLIECRELDNEGIDLTHEDRSIVEILTEDIINEMVIIDLTNEGEEEENAECGEIIDLTYEDEELNHMTNEEVHIILDDNEDVAIIHINDAIEIKEITNERSEGIHEPDDSKMTNIEHSVDLSSCDTLDKPSSESAYESEGSLNEPNDISFERVEDNGGYKEDDTKYDALSNQITFNDLKKMIDCDPEVIEGILSHCASSTSMTTADGTITVTSEECVPLETCCTNSESPQKSECDEVLTDDSKGEESLETYGYVIEDEDSLDNMVVDKNIMDYIDKCLNEPDGTESPSKNTNGCKSTENWQNDEDSLNNIKRDFYELTETVCSPHPSSESDHAHCVNNLTERVATHSAESILENLNIVSTSRANSENTPTLSSPVLDDSSPELFVEKIIFGGKELDVVYFDESILEQGGIISDIRILRTIPVGISGRIIGKKGKTKNELLKRYGAELLIYNHPTEQCKQVLQITCSPSLEDDLERWVDKTLDQILKNTIQTTVSNPEWLKPMIPIGKMVPVQIIDMPTIQHIKLRIYDPKMISAYNKMQAEINTDYSHADSNAILPSPVAVGCICIAMIRPDYFLRAEIISIYDQYAVVYLYDLGKTHQTCLFYLFKIREKYMKLPFQVIPARMPHAVIKNKKFTSAMVHKRFLCDQKTQRPHLVRAFFPRMNTCCEPCVHIYLPRSAIDGTNNESKNDCVDLLELLVSVDVCGMVRETVNCDQQVRMNENHFKNSLSEKERKHSQTTPVYYEPCNNKFYEDFLEFQYETNENK